MTNWQKKDMENEAFVLRSVMNDEEIQVFDYNWKAFGIDVALENYYAEEESEYRRYYDETYH